MSVNEIANRSPLRASMGDIKLTLSPVDELSAMADEQKTAAQQHFIVG